MRHLASYKYTVLYIVGKTLFVQEIKEMMTYNIITSKIIFKALFFSL
jgi:hypothetical protein